MPLSTGHKQNFDTLRQAFFAEKPPRTRCSELGSATSVVGPHA